MSPDKQKELDELRTEGKIKGLKRATEALDAGEWDDVAKLGKDLYVGIAKEEASLRAERMSIRAERAVNLQALATLGDHDGMRRLLLKDHQMTDILSQPKKLPSKEVKA